MRILLVVYDNDSYIHWFPQGLAYITAVLLREGHEVEIYNQDVHHYSESHFLQYLDTEKFELLMSSHNRTVELCNDLIKHKIDIKWDCNG